MSVTSATTSDQTVSATRLQNYDAGAGCLPANVLLLEKGRPPIPGCKGLHWIEGRRAITNCNPILTAAPKRFTNARLFPADPGVRDYIDGCRSPHWLLAPLVPAVVV